MEVFENLNWLLVFPNFLCLQIESDILQFELKYLWQYLNEICLRRLYIFNEKKSKHENLQKFNHLSFSDSESQSHFIIEI